jgi:hypothetical protein
MYACYSRQPAQICANLFRIHTTRDGVHDHIQRLGEDVPGSINDHSDDGEADGRIEPEPAEREDADSPQYNPD